MKTKTVIYSNLEICRNCSGSGKTEEYDKKQAIAVCPICNGSGKVKKTTDVKITIEPA